MFRYPDKPMAQINRAGLADLPESYMAQLKMDGWRTEIEVTGRGCTFISRHNKPIPVSCALKGNFNAIAADLPIGTILDAEWLARRPAARDEALWVFDIMQLGKLPLWSNTTTERFAILKGLLPPELIVPTATNDYTGLFDAMQDRPDAEGVVLKRLDAPYIGSFRQCAFNGGWLKAKWRAGEDGLTAVEPRMSYVT